jgi:hypothetical protein
MNTLIITTNANLVTPHFFAFELVLEYLNLKIKKVKLLNELKITIID